MAPRYKTVPKKQLNCVDPRLSLVQDKHLMNCTLSIANANTRDAEGEWECTVGHWSMGQDTRQATRILHDKCLTHLSAHILNLLSKIL